MLNYSVIKYINKTVITKYITKKYITKHVVMVLKHVLLCHYLNVL